MTMNGKDKRHEQYSWPDDDNQTRQMAYDAHNNAEVARIVAEATAAKLAPLIDVVESNNDKLEKVIEKVQLFSANVDSIQQAIKINNDMTRDLLKRLSLTEEKIHDAGKSESSRVRTTGLIMIISTITSGVGLGVINILSSLGWF